MHQVFTACAIKYLCATKNAVMIDTWVSNYSEGTSSSTGVAVNLNAIYKIRTFVRTQGGDLVFTIAFDRSGDAADQPTSWSYKNRDVALNALACIINIIDAKEMARLRGDVSGNRLYCDLARGFDIKKPA